MIKFDIFNQYIFIIHHLFFLNDFFNKICDENFNQKFANINIIIENESIYQNSNYYSWLQANFQALFFCLFQCVA